MPQFSPDEITLMTLYDPGTREGLIAALRKMQPYTGEDEQALREMTAAVLDKLDQMTDQQYSQLLGETLT